MTAFIGLLGASLSPVRGDMLIELEMGGGFKPQWDDMEVLKVPSGEAGPLSQALSED